MWISWVCCSCQYCSLLPEGWKKMLLPPDSQEAWAHPGWSHVPLRAQFGWLQLEGMQGRQGIQLSAKWVPWLQKKACFFSRIVQPKHFTAVTEFSIALDEMRTFFCYYLTWEKKQGLTTFFQKADCHICKYNLLHWDVESKGYAFTGTQYKAPGKVNPLTILYTYSCCWATPQHPRRIVEVLT